MYLAIILAALLSGALSASEAPVMKVSVMRDGKIFADGARIELRELRAAFTRLSAEGGSVIYYREDPEAAEPHPNAISVIQAIVETRLPISLSSEPDFSTVVLPDGAIEARE